MNYRKGLLVLAAAAACFLSEGCSRTENDGFKELELAGEELAAYSGSTNDNSGDTDGWEETDKSAPDGGQSREDEAGQETDSAFVYVCGAVCSPGVYELKSGARVFEAIELAGGMTEEAAQEIINQARVVSDGERIYVPTTEEAESYAEGTGVDGMEVTEGTDGKEQGKININTAGKDELMTLNGIGEAKAQSILTYREEHGKFSSIEDLMKIEGIKEGVFSKIKEDITI